MTSPVPLPPPLAEERALRLVAPAAWAEVTGLPRAAVETLLALRPGHRRRLARVAARALGLPEDGLATAGTVLPAEPGVLVEATRLFALAGVLSSRAGVFRKAEYEALAAEIGPARLAFAMGQRAAARDLKPLLLAEPRLEAVAPLAGPALAGALLAAEHPAGPVVALALALPRSAPDPAAAAWAPVALAALAEAGRAAPVAEEAAA